MSIWGILARMLRQRSVATFLTALTIAAGVALVAATLILREESERAFAQKETGFEILVGAKGSPLQLVLNSLYNVGPPVGNIAYSFLDSIKADPRVNLALPMVTGDNVLGYRVIGVAPDFFTKFEFRRGEGVKLAHGAAFTADYEAVIGAEIAAKGHISLNDVVTMTHGIADEETQAHAHGQVRICGVLEPTGTAIDRSVYTSLATVWDVHYVEYEEQRLAAEAAQAEFAADELTADDTEVNKKIQGEKSAEEHAGHDHAEEQADGIDTHDHAEEQAVESDAHDHGDHDHAEEQAVESDAHDHGDEDHADHDHGDHDHAEEQAVAAEAHDHGDHDHDHDHADHDHGAHDHAHHLHTSPGEKIAHEIPVVFQTISSVAVKLKSPIFFESFIRRINEASIAQATMPVREIQSLFAIVGNVNGILLAVSWLVIVIGALSIFVSIYNSLNERKREIAILRSLGAGRRTIFGLIELEAMAIALGGSLAGIILAHLGLHFFGGEISARVGVNLDFALWYNFELLLILGVVLLAALVACVPAWKAYTVDVAHNLAPIS